MGLLLLIGCSKGFPSVEIDDATLQPRMEESADGWVVVEDDILLKKGKEKILQNILSILFALQPTKCSDIKLLPELIVNNDDTLSLVDLFQCCSIFVVKLKRKMLL